MPTPPPATPDEPDTPDGPGAPGAPDTPDTPAGGAPQGQPSPEPRTPSLFVIVAVLAAGFVLLVCGAVAYIAWRHPAAAVPLCLAITLATALVPLCIAVFRR
ncbi:hypothetical protein ABZ825_39605 [Streptomyces tauricus]|uniref:hypothetical protein n=1 Tax=Streptomyces tauricus TaxID=68274 RepID=UPI0033FD1439